MITEEKYQITLDSVFTRHMVRYETLDVLIPYAFKDCEAGKATELNIFIDLYSLYHTMFSREFSTVIKDYTDFTVLIIDLCTHYRTYFRYLGVSTKIFLVSSYNIPNNISIPDYNKTMKDKLQNNIVRDMVEVNLELLRILCPYLPDIHFVETQFESSVLIYHIIREQEGYNPSLIITTDIYPAQLTTLFPNVALLYPLKHFGQDVSYIISPKSNYTHRDAFWSVITHKTGKRASDVIRRSLSTSNQVLLESMNSLKSRNITPVIINICESVKMIYNSISTQDIILAPDFLPSIEEFNRKYMNRLPEIRERFNALNVVIQYEYYCQSIEKATLHYENLQDPIAIQMINEKYFSNNPLDILRL